MAKDALRFLNLDPASPVNCTCNILDKEASTFNYVQYMFDRTNAMFHYTGLPDTIPEPMLEYMLQIYGSVAILEYHDNLYALRANFGGPPDPYFRPTQAVLANPALGLTGTYRIINHLPPFDRTNWESYEPCIRFLNDSQIMGLLPLFSRYAVQMTENDISIRCAQINVRSQHVIIAETGPEIESANAYMQGLEEGRLSAIMRKPFGDGVSITNVGQGQSNLVMQLIELQQYLKASWYNEIGLNSNFNMKSQYISSEEINSSADIMLPLIDNMYDSRRMAVEAINKHFGTNITVEKDSAWEKKQLQSDLGVEIDPVNGDIIGNPSLIQSIVPENDSPAVQSTVQDDESRDDSLDEPKEIVIDIGTDTEVKLIVEPKETDDEGDEEVNNEGGDKDGSDSDSDVEPETK